MVTKEIFVFGSNEAGRHGKGAALYAVQHHGAIYGKGWGLQGSSFAIPTKDRNIKTLPLSVIRDRVAAFLVYASCMKHLYTFKVTAIGCGLAGYKPEQIAPFFKGHPENVILPTEFEEVLNG